MRAVAAAACALSLAMCGAPSGADELAARRSARSMKIAGMVLTIAGAAVIVSGVVLFVPGARCTPTESSSCGGIASGIELTAGATLLGFGASVVATGVPLWVVGTRRLGRARVTVAPSTVALRF